MRNCNEVALQHRNSYRIAKVKTKTRCASVQHLVMWEQLKPEADIYQTLLDKFGLKAEECVFIDDRPVNCEGAQKAGIHTICFKSFKQAAAELEALGVK